MQGAAERTKQFGRDISQAVRGQVGEFGLVAISHYPLLVAIMVWIGEHQGLAVWAYSKTTNLWLSCKELSAKVLYSLQQRCT